MVQKNKNAPIFVSNKQKCGKSLIMVYNLIVGFVGKGFYGSTNEESMMKEIYENGPIAVAINAAPDLYYYSKGVFITNPRNRLGMFCFFLLIVV